MADACLTADRLRELLDYDCDTGHFTWLVTRGPVRAGEQAGSVYHNKTKTYRCVCIGVELKLYRAHRLAWLWMTGEWPAADIDHRDGDAMNNRWGNLRLATNAQNQANRKAMTGSKTGVKGVSPLSKSSRWTKTMFMARITLNGREVYLGAFPTIAEAQAVYEKAAREHFGEFASCEREII